MRSLAFAAAFVLLAGLVVSGSAAAHCAGPPCGPIPVVIDFKTGDKKKFSFEGQDAFTLDGTISVYIDIDQNGFWYDPEKPPQLTFQTNKQPPWLKARVEPDHFEVPIADPQYVGPEGSPDQMQSQFYWEAPIKITVKKLRDPTQQEIAKGSPWVRSDGTLRVILSASSTSSVLAPEVFGPNMGLQEGYGIKDLHVIPTIGGVDWLPNGNGELAPLSGSLTDAKGAAPGPWLGAFLVAVVALAYWRRR